MKKQSKRYKAALKQVEENKAYPLREAVTTLKNLPKPKFDASVDLHLKLNIDTKKSDQMVRGVVLLPHGTGKKIRVAVFCKGEQEKVAREAGADFVGANELIDKVAAGFLDFDSAIATPEMMKDLSRLGKTLGPRGLMPSPKTGTVTNDVKKAIEDLKKGKVEYRADKQSGIHLSVGRISFSEDQLYDNAISVIDAINEAKPASIKGKFILSSSVSSSMNPGLNISI